MSSDASAGEVFLRVDIVNNASRGRYYALRAWADQADIEDMKARQMINEETGGIYIWLPNLSWAT